MTRYGYIGLGMMGSAMVENLAAHADDLIVYDIDPAAMEAAVGLGAVAATSPAAVAAASDVVSICVPAAIHIEAVMSGESGIVEGVHENLKVLIHSTVSPETMRSARDVAATWGVPLFDACVAGGAEAARVGEQLVLAGGVEEMGDDVLALIDIYAATMINAGPVGAGAAIKIAFNVMTYAQFVAAATGHDLMVSAGGDPSALFEAWKDQGQLGKLTEAYSAMLNLPPEMLEGDLLDGLRTQVGIAEKDLALAGELGDTRPGAAEFLAAVSAAMPAAYNTL